MNLSPRFRTELPSSGPGSILSSIGLYLVLALPALAGRQSLLYAANLHHLANSANPYWIPGHAPLLYLWVPLVAVSTIHLFVTPGVYIASRWEVGLSLDRLLLRGFAVALVVLTVLSGVAEGLLREPLSGWPYLALVLCYGVSGVAWGSLNSGGLLKPMGPQQRTTVVRDLVVVVLPLLLLFAVLAPKFLWENLNPDGAHTIETVRLLFVQPFPFWGAHSGGEAGNWPGMTTFLFLYPASWFVRFLGDTEVAIRVPWLLYLGLVFIGLRALARRETRCELRIGHQILFWMLLAGYVVVSAYNFTYNPYSADIGLPATQDTLEVALFLAFILEYLADRRWWLFLFILMAALNAPNGLLLGGLWLLAAPMVAEKHNPWKYGAVGAALVASVAVVVLVPHLLRAMGHPAPGGEHTMASLLERFRYIQWGDLRRFLFLLLPAGIVPTLTLFLWKQQDRVGRALTLVTIGYFTVFYLQGYVSIHHFAPVMILPVVVFWRSEFVQDPQRRRYVVPAALLGVLLSGIILSPVNTSIHTEARAIGRTIEDRTAGYWSLERAAFRRIELFSEIVPLGYDLRVPEESYGATPLQLNYYAQRAPENSEVNYVLQEAGDLPPEGMAEIARGEGAVLYARSDSILLRHRGLRPPTPAGSEVLAGPRGMLFRGAPIGADIHVVDLCAAFREKLGWKICG